MPEGDDPFGWYVGFAMDIEVVGGGEVVLLCCGDVVW